MRSYPVKENPIRSAVSEIPRYKQTDRNRSTLYYRFHTAFTFTKKIKIKLLYSSLELDAIIYITKCLIPNNGRCEPLYNLPSHYLESTWLCQHSTTSCYHNYRQGKRTQQKLADNNQNKFFSMAPNPINFGLKPVWGRNDKSCIIKVFSQKINQKFQD